LYRFTVDEYERMVLDDPRVELIDGYVVTKMPKSPEHGFTTREVQKNVDRMLPPGWTWRQEQPVRIPVYNEPEPDLAIVRGADAGYRHRLPDPADVGLIVEVSRSKRFEDCVQGNVYAAAGIPVYWVVNLVDRQVEVYTDPAPAGYASRCDYLSGQQVPVVLYGQQLGTIAVDDILP
jgi:Uma2 family endonuclease